MNIIKKILKHLLDWDDKSELYTRIALSTIPLMFISSIIFHDMYHSPKITIMLIFTFMGIGIWSMVRRSKIEATQTLGDLT